VVQCVTGPAASVPAVPVPVLDVCGGLLDLFGGVPGREPGGRSGQGTDHPAAAVLALAAAAVVAGMKGYTAITGRVADVSAAVLADLYLRAGAIPARAPSKTTIWRVLAGAGPEMFDAAVGTWLMNAAGFAAPAAGGTDDRAPGRGALMQVRLDGKAIRGAKDADGNQVRLLAALAGPDAATSVVAAQAEVGKKTNEVPAATAVLDQIDLEGKIVTADALHTVKATAERIHERGGEFVLPVKENRPPRRVRCAAVWPVGTQRCPDAGVRHPRGPSRRRVPRTVRLPEPAHDRGLAGVTPGLTQMPKSSTVVRSYLSPDPPPGEARTLGAAVGAGCPGSRRS
jgi:DDE family transposase